MANPQLKFCCREPTIDTNIPVPDGTLKIDGFDWNSSQMKTPTMHGTAGAGARESGAAYSWYVLPGLYGAKGLGEGGIPFRVAPTIANAVVWCTGARIKKLQLTREKSLAGYSSGGKR